MNDGSIDRSRLSLDAPKTANNKCVIEKNQPTSHRVMIMLPTTTTLPPINCDASEGETRKSYFFIPSLFRHLLPFSSSFSSHPYSLFLSSTISPLTTDTFGDIEGFNGNAAAAILTASLLRSSSRGTVTQFGIHCYVYFVTLPAILYRPTIAAADSIGDKRRETK